MQGECGIKYKLPLWTNRQPYKWPWDLRARWTADVSDSHLNPSPRNRLLRERSREGRARTHTHTHTHKQREVETDTPDTQRGRISLRRTDKEQDRHGQTDSHFLSDDGESQALVQMQNKQRQSSYRQPRPLLPGIQVCIDTGLYTLSHCHQHL